MLIKQPYFIAKPQPLIQATSCNWLLGLCQSPETVDFFLPVLSFSLPRPLGTYKHPIPQSILHNGKVWVLFLFDFVFTKSYLTVLCSPIFRTCLSIHTHPPICISRHLFKAPITQFPIIQLIPASSFLK